jgi:hypothetical protein
MCYQWLNDTIKKMTIFDHAIFKTGLICLALLMAKLYPGLLKLEWYWYACVVAIAFVYFIAKFVLKRKV